MKRNGWIEGLLFVALLAAGVGVRVWFQHLPNFAPVAAIALFAGYFFRSWFVAACLPLAIMGISDHFLGGYDPRMMVLVHGTLALPVVCRGVLRHRFPLGDGPATSRYFAGVFAASLTASCVFFLVTNFGSWLWFDMYEASFSGLTRCYLNALPFFRHTLLGDMAYASLLFGGYAAAVQCGILSGDVRDLPADAAA